MALNWDNLEIISEEEDVVTTADFDIINVEGSERMIITSGERGDQGHAGTITIGTTTTLPAGSDATVVNRGTPEEAIIDFGIPRGADGASEWGDIGGTLSNQTDLQNALNAKANTADLGDMASEDDAPSDNKKYGRKNGDWVEVTEGGGGGSSVWGDISGTLSDQTDLQAALNAKADISSLGALAGKDKANWNTDLTNVPSTFPPSAHNHDDRYYTETEMDTALALKANSADVYSKSDVDTAMSAKANTADLGDLASKDTVDWNSDIANIPSTFPPSSHTHDDRYYTEGEIDTALSGKSNTGHTHTMSDVTDLPTLGALAEKDTVDWDTDIDDIPSTFPPSSHTHTTSDISNFPTLGSLAAKSSVDYSTSEVTNKPTLGTMSAVNDASSDGKLYGRKNGAWSEVTGGGGGGSAEWGDITGTLSDQTDLNTALGEKANNAIVANAFSTSTAYDIGDLVIYQGNLYKFTSAHSAGAWNASHVSAVIVADGFMKKTGDTMTGEFGIKNPNMSRSATSQSELVTSELWFLDANDEYLAWNQCGQETTGKIFFSFGAGRYKQNTSDFVSTNVGMFVDKNGNKSIKFTGGNDKDIWLDALGLSDSGWKSYNNSTKFSGTIYYRKIGNVLYFSSGGSIYLVANCTEYENLGTIPSGYRPSKDIVLNCYINTDVAVRPLGLRINASGIIYIYANSGETITPQHPIYLSGCGI